MNECDFGPDFCFIAYSVIIMIANKKKGVRKESEKEKAHCVCVGKKRIEIEKEIRRRILKGDPPVKRTKRN